MSTKAQNKKVFNIDRNKKKMQLNLRDPNFATESGITDEIRHLLVWLQVWEIIFLALWVWRCGKNSSAL